MENSHEATQESSPQPASEQTDESSTADLEQGVAAEEIPAVEQKAPGELSVEEIRELQAISAEYRAVSEERDKLIARLQRATADFLNSQKRMERELQTRVRYSLEDFVKELLPVVDNFARAIGHAQNSETFDDLLEGIELVSKQVHDVLDRHGVKPIEAVGKRFDPLYHEAISVAHDPERPVDTVLEETEKGYLLNDRVIRPAKVIVNKAPEAVSPKQTEEKDQ